MLLEQKSLEIADCLFMSLGCGLDCGRSEGGWSLSRHMNAGSPQIDLMHRMKTHVYQMGLVVLLFLLFVRMLCFGGKANMIHLTAWRLLHSS